MDLQDPGPDGWEEEELLQDSLPPEDIEVSSSVVRSSVSISVPVFGLQSNGVGSCVTLAVTGAGGDGDRWKT